LCDQQMLDDEMMRLDASTIEQGNSTDYEALESRRRLVRKERADLFDRNFALRAEQN